MTKVTRETKHSDAIVFCLYLLKNILCVVVAAVVNVKNFKRGTAQLFENSQKPAVRFANHSVFVVTGDDYGDEHLPFPFESNIHDKDTGK
jgi:hypothetical protein